MLALGLAACGGGGSDAAAPALPAALAPGTWAVLGSSTAAGVGASPGQGWVDRVAAQTAPSGVTLRNLALSGLTTYHALPAPSAPPGRPATDPQYNIDLALGFAPRLVMLAFPTNDTAAGYSAAETVANLRAMRDAAAARGAVTLVLSSQPRDAFDPVQRATLEAIDRDAGALFGVCFVALRAALSDAAGNIALAYSAGDGVHLNDAGHQVVAERVFAALRGGRCVSP